MALTSQRGAVATQHVAGRRTSSDALDDPSLPSPFHVLDDMPPTEHHSLPLAPTPGPPRPPLSSAPDPGAGVEGEGSAGAEERGALDPTSAVREIWLPRIFQHSRRHCP
ncbi:hypothetical protein EDB83DRAFT_2321039 [Lactarius deliciosus]|nr:hypothetical protein EDB83DRAFT_2321039 [Lactarius deliciosus]